jgi:hypothetical protein
LQGKYWDGGWKWESWEKRKDWKPFEKDRIDS